MPSPADVNEPPATLADKVEVLERIVNESNQLIQMSYLDDMTMAFVNEPAKAYRGGDEDHRGRRCFEYMMGLDEQCPFCPLRNRSDERSARTEVDNGEQVFSVKTVLTEWRGRPAFIEYAADVTPSRRAQRGFEEQMRTLLRSIPEAQGIMHLDLTDDRCISVNGSASNNLRSVEADVAVDTTLGQVFSFVPDDAERAEMARVFSREALSRAYGEGRVEVSRETESYFDDGGIRWARVTARIMQNPSNAHLECVLYGMDISEEVARRRELEERTHRQLALFNALARDYLNVFLIRPDDATAHILKLDGFVTSGLEADSSISYPYVETYERYIDERVHVDDRAMLRRALSLPVVVSELAKSEEYLGSYRVVAEGETHFYQFKFLVAENNEGILAGFQNIDATIAAERERQEILKTALAAAEEASLAKSTFLSSMSHDIRTPLNAVIGFNELARKHADDACAVRDYLDKAKVASGHLLDLVNDVLDLSRIESGRVEIDERPLELPAMLEGLRDMVASNAEASGVRLVFDDSGIRHANVVADELKIKKILVNILGNAVKFTRPGGTVWFSAEEKSLRTSDYAHVVFRVRDTGVGMSEKFLGRAFDAFAREHDEADGSVSGTGLGLSIVKSLVNVLDGSIHVESEKGVGSEFTVTLHLKVAEAAPGHARASGTAGEGGGAGAEGGEPFSLRGRRVLLAEDNEFNREIACEILKAAGCEVACAADGREAADAVADAAPGAFDLVLMDVQMPVMNGYEATRAIREMPDPVRAGVPIVAVTANAFSSDRDAALAAGMDGHISKPIDVDLLVDKMRELIAARARA